eukprot:COSAG06_NODE_692_length_13043_cov_369.439509_18_plen_240_part_00
MHVLPHKTGLPSTHLRGQNQHAQRGRGVAQGCAAVVLGSIPPSERIASAQNRARRSHSAQRRCLCGRHHARELAAFSPASASRCSRSPPTLGPAVGAGRPARLGWRTNWSSPATRPAANPALCDRSRRSASLVKHSRPPPHTPSGGPGLFPPPPPPRFVLFLCCVVQSDRQKVHRKTDKHNRQKERPEGWTAISQLGGKSASWERRSQLRGSSLLRSLRRFLPLLLLLLGACYFTTSYY